MEREKILLAMKKTLERNILFHSIALEKCMIGIFEFLEKNGQLTEKDLPKKSWQIAGLLHDIDYAGEFKDQHPNKTKEALDKCGLSISNAEMRVIKAHAPELTGVKPQNKAEWAIFCADSLTGLIVATALVYPSKKLADVKLSSILKRFHKEPRFAAGTRRDEVKQCENPNGLNIPVDKFIEICFEKMKENAEEIGL